MRTTVSAPATVPNLLLNQGGESRDGDAPAKLLPASPASTASLQNERSVYLKNKPEAELNDALS